MVYPQRNRVKRLHRRAVLIGRKSGAAWLFLIHSIGTREISAGRKLDLQGVWVGMGCSWLYERGRAI